MRKITMSNKFDHLHEQTQKKLRRTEHKLKKNFLESQFILKDLLNEASELFRDLSPIKRKGFLKHVVKELYVKQNGICPLCKRPIKLDKYDVDHIIPLRWGGGNEKANLQITHPSCNRSKGANIKDISKLVSYFEDKIMNL